jgi:1,4-dihydroxy-2-naphthoyl-CoA hydrolase
MALWKQEFTLEGINALNSNTLVDHLGIEFTHFDEQSISARMPVDHRTKQPMGLLHGGASVALAETLGSVASVLCLDDPMAETSVGLEINANHVRSATKGWVTGTCTPIKVGRRIHVWEINIHDEDGNHLCVSRLTIAIIKRRS